MVSTEIGVGAVEETVCAVLCETLVWNQGQAGEMVGKKLG